MNRSAIHSQLEDSLRLTNTLAYYMATLNDKQNLFHKENSVELKNQSNYCPLNENYMTDDPRYIKQRTDKWMEIRSEALVTGSTCNSALGLSRLKDQQLHFDNVVLKKPKPEFPKEVQERMKYGIHHEEDAVATVCSKVLPALYPDMKMYEEGCIRVGFENYNSFMVVSPDGSLKGENELHSRLAFENKCKSPDSYSKSAYYQIPLYYMPQLLCEMKACESDRLLFTCWSEESMTVFEVYNDGSVWEKCWCELTKVYAIERARPKHFSEECKVLKQDMKSFRDKNVHLIGEFPSVRSIRDTSSYSNVPSPQEPHILATPNNKSVTIVELENCQETLATLQKWHNDTYELLRAVASEILVFMVSDLDRIFDQECNNAHVVGYAMKGPSMKNDTLRNMIRDVIATCEKYGLQICVTSADGQWHQYGVRDDSERPLTVHQLKRDLWAHLRSIDKAKLQSTVKTLCLVQTLEDVKFEKNFGTLSVLGHSRDNPICSRQSSLFRNEDIDDIERVSQEDATVEPLSVGCLTGDFEEFLGPETIAEVDKIVSEINQSSSNSELYEDVVVQNEPLILSNVFLDETRQQVECEKEIGQIPFQGYYYEQCIRQEQDCVLEQMDTTGETDISQVYRMASNVLLEENWHVYDNEMEVDESATIGTAMESNVSVSNVQVISNNLQPVIESEIEVGGSASKETTSIDTRVSELQTEPGEDVVSHPTNFQSVMRSLNVDMFEKMLHDLQHDNKSLAIHKWRDLSLAEFILFCQNKDSMNKNLQKREVFICASCIERECKDANIHVLTSMPKYRMLQLLWEKSKNTQMDKHVPKKKQKLTTLKDLCWSTVKNMSKDHLMVKLAESSWEKELSQWKATSPIQHGIQIEDVCQVDWFSKPRVEGGLVRFHFTDACHILTCIRTKLCTTGIEGLDRKAWEIAALSPETNLNITLIIDCVDKQDVGLARRVFANDVEENMYKQGYHKEAKFCKLLRRWFESEDEPAIPAKERCQRRLELLNWLLAGYDIGKFPPPTRYVKGIPITTYEALVVHLERKIQLFSFVPESMYNVRATGTQEVEQFFSSFREMDPSGTGTVKPEIIPGMLASASEIDNFRLNPNK
ncbi:MAG: YqaJ viral recombinase family protein [Candidatus Thiodiazotropha sp.]